MEKAYTKKVSQLFCTIITICAVLISTYQKGMAQSHPWKYIGLAGQGGIEGIAITPGDSIFASSYNKVFRYNSGTSTWKTVDSNYTASYVLLAKSDNIIFVGSYNGVKRSLDGGNTWTAANTGIANTVISAMAKDSYGNIYAGGYAQGGGYNGLFRSTDNGSNWTNIGLTGKAISAIAVKSNGTIFAGTALNYGVLRSTDNGSNWTQVVTGMTFTNITSIIIGNDGYIYASDLNNGVYRSSDDGDHWTQVNTGLGSLYVNCLAQRTGGSLYTCSSNSVMGIYSSTNSGGQWTSFGLQDTAVRKLAINTHGTLFAASAYGVYSNLDMTANIGTTPEKDENYFQQNFPNPFTQSTTISFNLPCRSMVSLKVYDINGREISTIISKELNTGMYHYQWDAGNIPAGIYYCTLMTDSFSKTQKLILINK